MWGGVKNYRRKLMSYLEIKNLQKKYTKDGPLVVNNMNLSIEKGSSLYFWDHPAAVRRPPSA